MGLTSLPEVGAGEDLGPVKIARPLRPGDVNRDILTAEHNAAMAALEAVCAEVGLHDGSTAGSLVARVDALEDSPPGSGDVSGPGSSVIGRVVIWADTDGENIADGGALLSDLATTTALSDHATSTSNPHSVTATQVGAAPAIGTKRTVTASTTIATSRANEQLLVAVNGSDLYVTLVDGSTAGQRSLVTRGDLGGGGDVVIQGQDGDHVITGPTILTRGLDTIEVRLTSINGSTYYWVTSRADVFEDMEIRATHTASTRTVAARDRGTRTPLDPTSNAIAVTLPHTLPVGFACEFVALNVANAITFAGSGGLVLTYYGSSTITAGDIIRVSVESATVCRAEVVKTGDAAGTHIANTSNPHATTAAQVGADPKTTVQTAHTTSTLTLADADNNQHRALNTTSNSIAISIPDDLTFPFVWTARKSSASNSVTITTGAGLITPKTSGTVPVTAVDAYITIFAESSTVAAVFVTVAT